MKIALGNLRTLLHIPTGHITFELQVKKQVCFLTALFFENASNLLRITIQHPLTSPESQP